MPGFHALTGSDISHITGHIKGKGKSSCFKVFMKVDEDVICALAGLGVGVYPVKATSQESRGQVWALHGPQITPN